MMDRRVFDDRRRIGSVKAAVNMYGERILEGTTSSMKKSQMENFPEESCSRARELHMAKREVVRYKESRKAAESAKAKAESKLSKAKKTVKQLALQIDQSNLKVKEKVRDMEKINKSSKHKDMAMALAVVGDSEGHQYAELMSELEDVKQEVSKLKLDMASVVDEKLRAEKEFQVSSSKLQSNLISAEALRKEIEEVNEEHVLVELARIEALKEFGEIEAEKEKEANEFSFKVEGTKKSIKDGIEEIEHSEELESKLAVTLSDVEVLQNELKVAKEMERKVQRNDSLQHSRGSFTKVLEVEGSRSFRAITEELEAAKKELASTREEGFQFMTSMDIIRNELNHVTEQTTRLKKAEEKADLTVQNLNSKLLRAKSKLESATATEEKAKSVVSNLSRTLKQLSTETEVAKKEKKLIGEETAKIKAETQKTESEIELTEERLQAAMQELESVKASETLALEKLQSLIENTMPNRAVVSQHNSSITISKFEYEYLTGRAVGAEEIADKKVAAAQAWIEALKASEKEILMKLDIARRDIREMRVEEEHEVYRIERSLSAKKMVEEELRNWRHKRDRNTENEKVQRKSSRGNDNLTPSRRAKARKPASPGIRGTPRSTSFTIRKKKKVMPGLAKFFTVKKMHKHQ